MKLNDPFGRLEKRHQASYEMMRDAMSKSGITTVQAAQDVITESKNRSLKFLGVVLAFLLLIFFFSPNLMPALACLAVIMAIWTFKSVLNGRGYVNRYIAEELQGKTKGQDLPTEG